MFPSFEKLVDPFMPHAETSPSASVWQFVGDSLKPFHRVIALSLLLTLISASIEVWLIGYTSSLVDTLALAEPALLWEEHGLELIGAAAILLLLRPLAGFIGEGLDDIAYRPNAETLIRWRAHRHVQRQSVGWFRRDLSGRIANQVRDIGASATGAVYQVLHTLTYVMIYVIGSTLLIGSIDIRLITPLLVWIACFVGLMVYVVPRLHRASHDLQGANADLTGMLVDGYANIDVIKLFANQAAEDAESMRRFAASRSTLVAVQKLEVTVNVSMIFMGSLLIVGLVGYTVVLWQAGGAPLGLVAASLALSFRITGMAEWMLDAVSSMFTHLGATRQALQTVAQPLEVVDAPNAPALTITTGAIGFSGVSHHYGKGVGGLDGVSFDIAGGEKIGIVGRSGAGKSTLVNLLLRFFEAEAGQISIDGQDIATVRQDSLRGAIAMVSQDASLLHRSVRDNIAHGQPDASQATIAAAAEQAMASEFIAGLVDQQGRRGYDALVGERGVLLSGGQRQRIALARAIFKNAPILVLDEATSALDSEAEAAIQDTLYGVMEGKTVIAIAHRLSTIARMDRIVVLDQGRIAELGSHDSLLAQNGIYAQLWARQSGGFIGNN
ncbi:ABC transporter ATP-binding protein [Devosia sp. BSSL-BM10]|uniref:ABC transporter ATP-binding protein n=1 Tax=Devosia litorisediminis TaxID=2829817 RepID=A0A942E6W0_9HYPH|nr:ABC transporter ATP-binding protein [Devosia litorisediminis]MBS3849328.1 ABC transporter ATP-binding protein [Devosia litorisediminis]